VFIMITSILMTSREGYSVFAVTQLDSAGPLALPRSEADDVAAIVPEPSSANSGRYLSTSTSQTMPSSSAPRYEHIEGLEDEDMELQQALQASLIGGTTADAMMPPPLVERSGFTHPTGTRTPTQTRMPGTLVWDDEDSTPAAESSTGHGMMGPSGMDEDMVAASMARSRAMFERMRREQEAALRDSYDDEVTRLEMATSARLTSAGSTGDDTLENEQEMIRRAIEESRRTRRNNADAEDEDDPPALDSAGPIHPALDPTRPRTESYRSYDDEDEELQAALRASLESVPEGFRLPSSPPLASMPATQSASLSVPTPSEAPRPLITRTVSAQSEAVSELSSEMDSTASESEIVTAAPTVDHDEIRRRRLARFGG
jgi:Ataxin-3